MDDQAPSRPKRTPEQEAAVQRHLKNQDRRRSRDEPANDSIFSPIANTSAGIILRIALRILRSAGKLIISDGGGDVNLKVPLGMVMFLAGGLLFCVGLVVWVVIATTQAIWRAIAGSSD